MTITKTDQKYINRLFELKPDCTGKELLSLIEWQNTTDMRVWEKHHKHCEDETIAYVSGISIN